jgi:hypothetical protein
VPPEGGEIKVLDSIFLSKLLWLVLLPVCILVWIGFPVGLAAQDPAESSYRLQTSVMGAAGSPGASGAKRTNGTLAQATPIGVGSSSGKTLYAGFWSRPWVLASILETEDDLTLTNRIYQNFPNPFTHATTIAYSVKSESRVEIAVFNVNGQRVRTLISEQTPPGRHFTSWDGTTEAGSNASPGVYFCRMTVADYRASRKMLFIR